MRLIDADAIKARIHEICSFEWNHKVAPVSWADAYEDFEEDIDAAPTIDAIPVEWLEEHDGENISDSDGNIYGRRHITISEALSMWQKEQEAQDG